MNDDVILQVLKIDLQISTDKIDTLLTSLIGASKEYIATEGIHLKENIEDGMLVEMYAAYLYRKRKEANPEQSKMPRMLRYQLNNRLFKEKGKVD